MGLIDSIWGLRGIEIFDGFVADVNEAEQTCSVNIAAEGEEALILPGVALRSVSDGDNAGIMFIPERGSHVVFCKIEGQSDYVLIKTSKLRKVILNCDDIVINEGLNEGLVKVLALTDKLNAIENEINELKNALLAWMPIPNDGGAALKSVVTGWASQAMTLTNIKELQNDKIKH